MGRKRQTKRDEKLPPYVSRITSRDCITVKEYLGKGKFGSTRVLRDSKGRRLSSSATSQQIWEAYKHLELGTRTHTLEWLFSKYFKSPRFTRLAVQTRRNYEIHSESICKAPLKTGQPFGEVDLTRITPQVIARYRDKWEPDKRVGVVREMQFMSSVFSWAVEQGHMASNPAKGVRKPSTTARDRYVTQAEMKAVQANCKGSPYLRVAMELAYLCRARASEVLAMQNRGDVKRRISGVVDEGVYVRRTKGSDSEITLWTPRLKAAINEAKALHKDVISPHLLCDRRGNAITYAALRSSFVRALEAAKVEKFTFHDLKAAGISDHKNQAGGHRSARMREVYVRVPDKVEATE